jgi:hypothetical protein
MALKKKKKARKGIPKWEVYPELSSKAQYHHKVFIRGK